MRCQREHARSGWRPGPESAKLDRSAVLAGCRLPWRRVRRPVPVSIINPAKASRAAGVGMPAVDTRASVESLGIGRAHVCTPVNNAHIVCRLLLEKKTNVKPQ